MTLAYSSQYLNLILIIKNKALYLSEIRNSMPNNFLKWGRYQTAHLDSQISMGISYYEQNLADDCWLRGTHNLLRGVQSMHINQVGRGKEAKMF